MTAILAQWPYDLLPPLLTHEDAVDIPQSEDLIDSRKIQEDSVQICMQFRLLFVFEFTLFWSLVHYIQYIQ